MSRAELSFAWLTHAAWQAGLLALAVLAVTWLLKGRLDPRWRFALWMVVFARLAMPILPTAPWSLFGLASLSGPAPRETVADEPAGPEATRVAAAAGEMVPEVEFAPDWRVADALSSAESEAPVPPLPDSLLSADSAPAAPSTANVSWLRLAALVWMAGVAFLFARHVVSASRFRRQRKTWQRATDSHELAMLHDCRRELGLRRAVQLYLSPGSVGPATCGILRPGIILPQRLLASHSPAELRLVLLHELVHVRRCDVLWDRLVTLIAIVHWFHPVGWAARFLLRKDRELACDAAVLDCSAEQTAGDYGRVILKTVQTLLTPTPLPGLVGMFNRRPQSFLERRIRMIAGYRRGTWASVVMGGAVLLALVLVGLTDAQSKPAAREDVKSDASAAEQPAAPRAGEAPKTDGPAKQEEKAKTITFRGRVIDAEGRGVPKAELWLPLRREPATEAHAQADERGEFQFTIPREWVYPDTVWDYSDIWAYAQGHSIAIVSAERALFGGSKEAVEVRLGPPTKTTFVVLDPDGKPLAGAKVSAHRIATIIENTVPRGLMRLVEGVTDGDGRVALPAVPTRALAAARVVTKAYGTQDLALDWMHDPKEDTRTIRLRRVGRVEGRVIAEKPEWVRGIKFQFATYPRDAPFVVGEAFAETDAEGKFVVPTISDGALGITDFLDRRLPVRPWLPHRAAVAAGETTTLEIHLVPGVLVRGRVEIVGSGKPLAGVLVAVYYNETRQIDTVLTDKEGRFETRAIPGDTLQGARLPHTYADELVERQSGRIRVPSDVETFDLPTIQLVKTVRYAGRLIDKNGKPVPRAIISGHAGRHWYPLNPRQKQTDDQGNFSGKMPEDIETFTARIDDVDHQAEIEKWDPLLLRLPIAVVEDGAGKATAPPARGAAKAEAVRILHFPTDRSVGIVFARQARADGYDLRKQEERWERLGEARGDVAVAKDAEVRLEVSAFGAQDLSSLDRLEAGDLSSLVLRGTEVNDDQLKHVGRFTSLAHLELGQTPITDAGIKHLAGLVNLRIVHLDAFLVNRKGFGVGDESLAILAKMPQLAQLSLRLTKVSDTGMVHVGRMKALESLSLSGTGVTDAGLVHLKELPALKYLDLGSREEGKNFTDEGARHVAQLSTLKWLRMSAPRLTDAGLLKLSALTRLEHLEVEDTLITSAGLAALKPLTSLKGLRLPDGIDDAGAKHLSELAALEQIQSNFFALSDAGVADLSKLKRLEGLNIGGKRITDASLEHISRMESLKRLMVYIAPVTDAGLAHLKRCPKLESLFITSTDITPDGLQHLVGLRSLKSLGFSQNKAGDLKVLSEFTGLTYLSLYSPTPGKVLTSDQLKSVGDLKNLESLDISDPVVDDSGIAHLASLGRLKRLTIRESKITDLGMASIGKLERLEHLSITGLITDRGLDELTGLQSLKSVYVSSPGVTKEGLDRLRQSVSTLQSLTQGGRPVPIDESTRNPRDGILRYGGAVRRARTDLLEGRAPPPLRLDGWVNTEGKALRLEDLKGKVVLLDFWGVWCGPCIREMPGLQEMQKEHAAHGLVIVGIHATHQADKMAEFVKDKKLTLAMALDVEEATAKAYHVTAYPSYYLIDRGGKLRMAAVHSDDLAKAVKLLLTEKDVGKGVR